jgi:hypothetical protein
MHIITSHVLWGFLISPNGFTLLGSCTQVPWVTGYGPTIWLRLAPKVARWLWDQTLGPRALGHGLTIMACGPVKSATKQGGTFPNQRLHTRSTPISGGWRRRQGVPSTSTPHMGWLGGQVGPIPHSTDSRNLPKHLPPQRQELFKIGERTMEASTDPDKPTFWARGLAGRVILPLM